MPRKRLTHKRRPANPACFSELEEHQSSRRVASDHPVTCGCRFCLLELGAELDSMEDEDQPYFWNRRTW